MIFSHLLKMKFDKDAFFFTFVFLVLSIILFAIGKVLGIIGLFFTLCCLLFFRDPDRFVPTDENVITSPADGIVVKIAKVAPPKYLELEENKVVAVSIFLSVFDVHVNRSPVSGIVTQIKYMPGKFFNASLDKADKDNERNMIAVTMKNKKKIVFEQIAGLIARRIRTDIIEDEVIEKGQRVGIIRFGSRVTMYLPEDINIKVCQGQIAIGGETIIADFSDNASGKKLEIANKKI